MEKHLKMCRSGSKHCTVCPVRGLRYDPFKVQPLVSPGRKATGSKESRPKGPGFDLPPEGASECLLQMQPLHGVME